MKNPNLILTPVETSAHTFCRHCGERIKMNDAGDHLFICRPEAYFAIDAEFDAKEARALELAAN